MSMLRKIKTGCIRREWLEAIGILSQTAVCLIFVHGHAGVKGNERADRLADMAVEQGVKQWIVLTLLMSPVTMILNL
jgi:ribonuclease HI